MITREELSEFVSFCQVNYQIEINPVIIEEFMHSIQSKEETLNDDFIGCSSNNSIECAHLSFDSAKCNECKY